MENIILLPLDTDNDEIKLLLITRSKLNLIDNVELITFLNNKFHTNTICFQNGHQGSYTNDTPGYVILKNTRSGKLLYRPIDVEFKFNVYLACDNSKCFEKENRHLFFWYNKNTIQEKKIMYDLTNDFLSDLFIPNQFPRDYVGFVMKVMKLMQNYDSIDTMQLKFRRAPDKIPVNLMPSPIIRDQQKTSAKLDGYIDGALIQSQILQIIESVYPSSISNDTLHEHLVEALSGTVKHHYAGNNDMDYSLQLKRIQQLLTAQSYLGALDSLKKNGKVLQLKDGCLIRNNELTRLRSLILNDDSESESPPYTTANYHSHKQDNFNRNTCKGAENIRIIDKRFGHEPVVAIITSLFCEKIAVDAIMDNAFTFVKYKSQGSHHLYTIGNVGKLKVVSMKLSMLGKPRHAMISASNAITRLLGTFPSIKCMLAVGTGSAINRFTDYRKKFKFGDIVVSTTNPGCHYVYVRAEVDKPIHGVEDMLNNFKQSGCTNLNSLNKGDLEGLFNVKTWKPKSEQLGDIVHAMVSEHLKNPNQAPWISYAKIARDKLHADQTDFKFEPPMDTNCKSLPISIGGDDYLYLDESFEEEDHVNHGDNSSYKENVGLPAPSIHLGAVASFNLEENSTNLTPAASRISPKSNPTKANPPLTDSLCQHLERYFYNTITPRLGILSYDHDFDLILDAMEGNCIDDYVLIRGISQVNQACSNTNMITQPSPSAISDGNKLSSHKITDSRYDLPVWAPYASLNAAAFAKAIILELQNHIYNK